MCIENTSKILSHETSMNRMKNLEKNNRAAVMLKISGEEYANN